MALVRSVLNLSISLSILLRSISIAILDRGVIRFKLNEGENVSFPTLIVVNANDCSNNKNINRHLRVTFILFVYNIVKAILNFYKIVILTKFNWF